MNTTYWNNNGKYQTLAGSLQAMIPAEGSVTGSLSCNRALEKFRKASNCYYDLYNNGLGNRSVEFRSVFNINPSSFRTYPSGRKNSYHRDYSDQMYTMVESQMNQIVLAAAEEQGLINVVQ